MTNVLAHVMATEVSETEMEEVSGGDCEYTPPRLTERSDGTVDGDSASLDCRF